MSSIGNMFGLASTMSLSDAIKKFSETGIDLHHNVNFTPDLDTTLKGILSALSDVKLGVDVKTDIPKVKDVLASVLSSGSLPELGRDFAKSDLIILIGLFSGITFALTQQRVYGLIAAATLGVSFLSHAPPGFWAPLFTDAVPTAQMATESDQKERFSLRQAIVFVIDAFLNAIGLPRKGIRVFSSIDHMVRNFDRYEKNVPDVIARVMHIIDKIFAYISTHIFGVPREVVVRAGVLEVDQWATDCMSVINRITSHELKPNSEVAGTVRQLFMQGNEFVASSSLYRNNDRVARCVNQVRASLQRIYLMLEAYGFSINGFRQEPITVLLQGSTGIGKSTAVAMIFRDLAPFLIEDPEELRRFMRNPNDFIYARQPEQKFWDAYNGQLMCAWDEFLQSKDTFGPDSEAMEIIRCSNGFANVLHMADLSQKGNTAFNSKVLLLTTNIRHVNPSSIVDQGALIRRLGMCYNLSVKREFATKETADFPPEKRVLDFEAHTKHEVWRPEMYEFRPFKYTSTGMTEFTTVLSYSQFMRELENAYTAKKHFTERYMAEQELVAKRSAERNHGIVFDGAVPQSSMDDVNLTADVPHVENTEFPDIIMDEMPPESPPLPVVLEDTLMWGEAIRSIASCGEDELPADLTARWRALAASKQLMPPVYSLTMTRADIPIPNNAVQIDLCDYYIEQALELTGLTEEKLLSLHPVQFIEWIKAFEIREKCFRACFEPEKVLSPLGKIRSATETVMSNMGIVWKRTTSAVGDGINVLTKGQIPNTPLNRLLWTTATTFWTTAAMFAGISVMMKIFYPLPSTKKPKAQSDSKADRRALKHYQKLGVRRLGPKGPTYQDMSNDYGGAVGAQFSCSATIVPTDNCKPNMYTMKFSKEEGGRGGVLFIKENILVFPRHYMNTIQEMLEDPNTDFNDDSVLILHHVSRPDIPVRAYDITGNRVCDTEELFHRDLVIVALPGVKDHKDITKYFVEEAGFKNLGTLRAGMLLARDDEFERCALTASRQDGITVYDRNVAYKITDHYTYPRNGRKGDCGALLYSNMEGIQPGKIIGIHVAGIEAKDDPMGITSVITKEIVEDACNRVKPKATAQMEFQPRGILTKVDYVPPGTNFKLLAKMDVAISSPVNTRIRRSALHGMWGPALTAPARLGWFELNGERVHPMTIALRKYSVISPDVDAQCLDIVRQSIIHRWSIKCDEIGSTEFLEYEDAVAGVKGDPYIKGIPRATSAGFPYAFKPDAKGKKHIWGSGPEYDFDTDYSDEVEMDVDFTLRQACKKIRLDHYFCDFLKDEKRPKEKVAIGSTRLISGSPVVFQVAFRSVFMPYIAWTMRNRLTNGLAPGINAYSNEWHIMALALLKKQKNMTNVLAGDFGNFDGSQNNMIHNAVRDIFDGFAQDNPYIDDSYKNIRDTLWLDVTNPKHICGSDVYEWKSKLSSGTPGTTTINSIYTLILFMYAWLRLHPCGLGRMCDFWDHVVIFTFGDDHIVSISDEVLSWYNGVTITGCFERMGLKYTNTDKDGPPILKTLWECTFLKRGFRYEKRVGRVVAPLELTVILEIPYWIDKQFANVPTQVTQLVQTALDELSLHGEEVFRTYSTTMLLACSSKLIPVPERTEWATCLDFITSAEMIWE
jgi:hypothetical protein